MFYQKWPTFNQATVDQIMILADIDHVLPTSRPMGHLWRIWGRLSSRNNFGASLGLLSKTCGGQLFVKFRVP